MTLEYDSENSFSWGEDLELLRQRFESNTPYKHLVLEGVLQKHLFREAVAEFPPMDKMQTHFHGHNDLKSQHSDLDTMPPALQKIGRLVNDERFVKDLAFVTGIPELLPDMQFNGGGCHQGADGSFLDVHADFNFHKGLGLYRRLNLIIYLNPTWEADWGGALELWDAKMKKPEKSILPIGNRCVIFETTDTSFHGYRQVTLPPGSTVTRKSFAAYYYTAERHSPEVLVSEFTRFQGRPDEPLLRRLRTQSRTFVKELLTKLRKP